MAVRKIRISLPPEVSDMLGHVENKSGYIATAVRQRWRKWSDAWNRIQAHAGVLANIDALIFGHDEGDLGRARLERAQFAADIDVIREEYYAGNQRVRSLVDAMKRLRPEESA